MIRNQTAYLSRSDNDYQLFKKREEEKDYSSLMQSVLLLICVLGFYSRLSTPLNLPQKSWEEDSF